MGGELYYTLLDANTNRYEITAQIFIDCENGNTGAIEEDETLIISMWNASTGTYQGDFFMRNPTKRDITENENYNCVINPGNVCISAFVFKTTQTINPGLNGTIISWQRCCRNVIIDNITTPGDVGFTAWTKIPGTSVSNNSAYFTEVPPIYVCVDAPLEVDQSATDPDGDSLVYSFNTPYLGGANNPADRRRPNSLATYEAPPFRRAQWVNTFGESVQMIGNPSANIDPKTGLFTITPTQIGVFVVGIKVDEYRNGVLIGTTYRDYQYTVIDCEFDVLANFTVPNGTTVDGSYTFECGDTVNFRNISILRPDLVGTFFWDFGDPTTTSDTITTFSKSTPVSYVYPGNGNYTVKLTVTSDICKDDYEYNIRIRSTKDFTLGPDRIFCETVNYTLDTRINDAVSITWNTGESGRFIIARDTGLFIADVSYGKCFYSDSIHLSFDNVPESKLLEDTLICDSLFTVTLDVGQPDLFYEWKAPDRRTTQSIDVSDTGIYTVAISNTNCTIYDTARVWQATYPVVGDTLFCNEFDYTIDLGDIEEAEFMWSNGSTSSSTNFTTTGTQWVKITQRNCMQTDTFILDNSILRVDLGDSMHFCDTMRVVLDAGSDGVIFDWSTEETTRTITVDQPGKYSVLVTNAEGCKLADSVSYSLTISPDIALGDDTTICVNSPTTIGVPEGYTYEWNTGDTENSITTILEGKYKVIVTDEFGCTDEDSLFITVDPTALPNELFIPNAFTPNNDNTNEWFPYSIEVLQPAFKVRVYSRWGEKLFDSEEAGTTRWDGQYKGKKIPAGVYVYMVSYRGCDGDTRTDRGTIHAIY